MKDFQDQALICSIRMSPIHAEFKLIVFDFKLENRKS